MAIRLVPGTTQRINFARGNNEVTFDVRTGDSTLDNEDVVVIGTYEDEKTKETHFVSKFEALMGGGANELNGTDAGLLGGRDFSRTERGNNQLLTRTRTRDANFKFADLR